MNLRKTLKRSHATCYLIGDFVNFLRTFLDHSIRYLRKTCCTSVDRIYLSTLSWREKDGMIVETKCDPRFRQQFDLLNASISLEDTMALASEVMELRDVLNRLSMPEQYAFWKGYEFASAKSEARAQSIKEKRESLMHKWGAGNKYLTYFSDCLH